MTALQSMTRLPQAIRNVQRLREILSVVARYGFEEVVLRLGVDGALERLRRTLRLRLGTGTGYADHSYERRIRLILEELGPTFIKFGQILATRPDVVPASLIEELKRLQDAVRPFPTGEARRIISEDLGRDAAEIFAEFGKEPIAAASIAQVYRARLHGGEHVAVKVRRPGLVRVLETDIDILRVLAELMHENIPESRAYDPRGLVAEFSRSIAKETDFKREAFYITKFGNNFRDVAYVYCPAVHHELCSERVLTMEFIEGIRVSDIEALDAAGCDRRELATNGTRAVVKMIFEDGFFHADPHPGNVLIRSPATLCFLDYGLMGSVDSERIDELLIFLVGLLSGDMDRVVELFHRLDLVDDAVDFRALKTEIREIVDRYGHVPLGNLDAGDLMNSVIETIVRHRIRVPADLFLVVKTITTMEGIARQLWPDYDPLSEMRELLTKIYVERLTDPGFLVSRVAKTAEAWLRLLARFPDDAETIIARLGRGDLTLRTETPALEAEAQRRTRALHYLGLALLSASSGSVATWLALATDIPTPLGIPLAGLTAAASYAISISLGSIVTLAALRETFRN